MKKDESKKMKDNFKKVSTTMCSVHVDTIMRVLKLIN